MIYKKINSYLFEEEATSLANHYTLFVGIQPKVENTKYAFLNWRFGNEKPMHFAEMGENFLTEAIISVRICLDDNSDRKADAVVFPILFNVLHGIELYLKAILYLIYDYAILVGNQFDEKLIWGHKDKTLLTEVEKQLRCNGLPFDKTDIAKISKILDEVTLHTPDETFTRYPFDTKNVKQFYVKARKNVIMDIEQLHTCCCGLFYILDKMFKNLEAEINSRIEAA